MIITVVYLTLIHILINPKLEIFEFVCSSKSDTFSSLGDFFISAVDEEVVLASVASICCHKSDIRLDCEHKCGQVALINVEIFDRTILISTKNVVLLLSVPK